MAGQTGGGRGGQQQKFRQPEWAFESVQVGIPPCWARVRLLLSNPALACSPCSIRFSRGRKSFPRYKCFHASSKTRLFASFHFFFDTLAEETTQNKNIQSNLTWKMVEDISWEKERAKWWKKKETERKKEEEEGEKKRKRWRETSQRASNGFEPPVPRSRPTTNGTLLCCRWINQQKSVRFFFFLLFHSLPAIALNYSLPPSWLIRNSDGHLFRERRGVIGWSPINRARWYIYNRPWERHNKPPSPLRMNRKERKPTRN